MKLHTFNDTLILPIFSLRIRVNSCAKKILSVQA